MQVFISYERGDSETVGKLAAHLERDGLSLVMPTRLLAASTSWREELERATNEADAYIVVISPRSEHSQPMQSEQRAILGAHWDAPGKPVIPVLVGDTAIPPAFQGFQVVRLAPSQDVGPVALQVLMSLREVSTRGLASPPADELSARLDEIGRLNEQFATEH